MRPLQTKTCYRTSPSDADENATSYRPWRQPMEMPDASSQWMLKVFNKRPSEEFVPQGHLQKISLVSDRCVVSEVQRIQQCPRRPRQVPDSYSFISIKTRDDCQNKPVGAGLAYLEKNKNFPLPT
ncbi:hypothetical protein E2P81_ATG00671 [Venturia nashicola]|nr:hypothetical protein E2P81_ATG00671 [Venturia nashicola]